MQSQTLGDVLRDKGGPNPRVTTALEEQSSSIPHDVVISQRPQAATTRHIFHRVCGVKKIPSSAAVILG